MRLFMKLQSRARPRSLHLTVKDGTGCASNVHLLIAAIDSTPPPPPVRLPITTQSIDGVQWPPGLKTVVFGQSFDQPIVAVQWPLALEEITFGGRFHQPIHRVSFPPGLRRLTFGWR